jgi:hypothetical protein
MTGLFTSGILKYARACNPDCCFDDVFDDGLVADSLLATTYRTNAGSKHAHGLTTVLDYSDHSQDEEDRETTFIRASALGSVPACKRTHSTRRQTSQ